MCCEDTVIAECREWLAGIGLRELPAAWEARLRALREALIAGNQTMNLTRLTEPEDYWRKHVADSLLLHAVYPQLAAEPAPILDVGSGAGFPGLPLAITFPRLRFRLIDSTGKKVAFIQAQIAALGLDNAVAEQARAGEMSYRDADRGRYGLVVARAVGKTPGLVEECQRFLAPGAVLAVYKTPQQVEAERKDVYRVCRQVRLTMRASEVCALPGDAGSRQFWLLGREDEG